MLMLIYEVQLSCPFTKPTILFFSQGYRMIWLLLTPSSKTINCQCKHIPVHCKYFMIEGNFSNSMYDNLVLPVLL